jgi:hypothetical protein
MNNKARNSYKNGRYKGIPKNLEIFIISGFLIGLSPYVLSIRIRINNKIKISPNRIRNFLRDYGINWRDWKKNGQINV